MSDAVRQAKHAVINSTSWSGTPPGKPDHPEEPSVKEATDG